MSENFLVVNLQSIFFNKDLLRRFLFESNFLLNKINSVYTLKNQRLKITQLEKAHFIKGNELKVT